MTTVLPYAGTSGWTSTDTSEDRARSMDESGQTAKYQDSALAYLEDVAEWGATWRELAEYLGAHHGTASGILSILHKAGKIARLAERRDKCKVYVLPRHIAGRLTESPGRTKKHPCPACGYEQ